jgi:Family of unknown function (DUF6080)
MFSGIAHSRLANSETAPLAARDGTATDRVSRADYLIAAALAACAIALYAPLGLRLARGVYLEYFNLAFDFDPIRYVGTFGLTPADAGGIKHPLVLLLRPLAWPFLAAGLDAKQAAVLVMACFGGGSVAICYLFLRVIQAARVEAAALTVLFAVTGTQVFTAIITESYGPAGFGIAALWLVTALRLADGKDRSWQRYAIAVFCFGVTVTNVMQVVIAEFLVSLRDVGLVRAVKRGILFGLVCALIIAVLAAAVWHQELREALADPVFALKQVYWLRTKGERTGAFQVIRTFIAWSFVSPDYDTIHLPEGIDMRDFRSWRFSWAGEVAVWCWLMFLAGGVLGWLTNRRAWWLGGGIATALLANIVFHFDFQFRGSLYIYAAHMHFLVFALAAGLAPRVRALAAGRWVYIGAVVALTVLIGANNLPIAAEFARSFDTVTIDCPAPCTEQTPQ